MLTWPKWILNSYSFVIGNFRLVIEYALIGTVVGLCGFTAALWASKHRTEVQLASTTEALGSVTASLDVTLATVKTNLTNIETLRDLRTQDAVALAALVGSMASLAEKDYKVRTRLQKLESTNEVVKQYLDTDIPPDIICLLDDTCEAGNQDSPRDKNVPH